MEDDLHSWWSVSHIFQSASARNRGGKLTFAPTKSNFLIWRADRCLDGVIKETFDRKEGNFCVAAKNWICAERASESESAAAAMAIPYRDFESNKD